MHVSLLYFKDVNYQVCIIFVAYLFDNIDQLDDTCFNHFSPWLYRLIRLVQREWLLHAAASITYTDIESFKRAAAAAMPNNNVCLSVAARSRCPPLSDTLLKQSLAFRTIPQETKVPSLILRLFPKHSG
jgi:hypothetical protein